MRKMTAEEEEEISFFFQCSNSNGMETAMGSPISMTVFNCRDQRSTTTKDHKISTNNCIKTNDYEDQHSTANVKTKDQQL